MVRQCVMCGDVSAFAGVSLHRFPLDAARRLQWVQFVENNGFAVRLHSSICSRHFDPVHYLGGQRRRLDATAIPSIVVEQRPADDLEQVEQVEIIEVHMVDENDIEVVEVHVDDENEIVEIQVDDVMDDNDVEVIVVQMDDVIDDNGIEVIEVPMEQVPDIGNAGVLNIIPPNDNEQVEPIHQVVPVVQPRARVPLIDRPAGIQHPLPDQHHIGGLHTMCRHCVARHFACECTTLGHFSTCCNNGLVAVSGRRELREPPELLKRLLVEDSTDAVHFRKEIRRYNNTLAFAAFSSDLSQRQLPPGRGPNVFTVHGQAYRTISNDLIVNEPMQRRHCQLYFLESGEANTIRRQQQQQQPAAHRLRDGLLADLDGMLRAINPFARAFQ